MVGDYPERDVGRVGERAAIFFAAHVFQSLEDRREDVGFVVGDDAGEILEAFGALDDGAGALEAHAGIDVLGRKRREGSVGVGVELDEDEVSDFHAGGTASVDHF